MTKSSISRTFTSYYHPPIHDEIRKRLGCKSLDLVKVMGLPIVLRGYWLNYHNWYHYEISRLERIRMGNAEVSGIHGFYHDMFHDELIEAEYDGTFDEARVAVHEWMTHPSIYNTCKLCNWIIWFIINRINPITVMIQHYKSLKVFQDTNSSEPKVYFQICIEPLAVNVHDRTLKIE